jgi:hypothetical protein
MIRHGVRVRRGCCCLAILFPLLAVLATVAAVLAVTL